MKTSSPSQLQTASCTYSETSFPKSTPTSWPRVYSPHPSSMTHCRRLRATCENPSPMERKTLQRTALGEGEPLILWMISWARILWAMRRTTSSKMTMVLAMPTMSTGTGNAQTGILIYTTIWTQSGELRVLWDGRNCTNPSSLAVHLGEGIGGIYVSFTGTQGWNLG